MQTMCDDTLLENTIYSMHSLTPRFFLTGRENKPGYTKAVKVLKASHYYWYIDEMVHHKFIAIIKVHLVQEIKWVVEDLKII